MKEPQMELLLAGLRESGLQAGKSKDAGGSVRIFDDLQATRNRHPSVATELCRFYVGRGVG